MGNRRKSRELALQALFYIDVCHEDAPESLDAFLRELYAVQGGAAFFPQIWFLG